MSNPNLYWLVIVAADAGQTTSIGCLMVPTEEEAVNWRHRRGELCDALELYMGEDIPEDLCVEAISYEEYRSCYGDRYPLNNVVSLLE